MSTTLVTGGGIVNFCLVRNFDKSSSKMAALNERLVLEANLCIVYSSAFLVNKKSGAQAHDTGSQDCYDRWNRAVFYPSDPVFEVVRIVSTCFQKIAGITGVVDSDPNDRNDYMEAKFNIQLCRYT